MRRYIDTTAKAMPGQLLQLVVAGEVYRIRLLHASTGERHQCGRERRVHEHVHADVYHVVLFTKGTSRFSLQGKPQPSQAGTLVLTGPGQPHDFSGSSVGEHVYSEITFALHSGSGAALRISFGELLQQLAGVELGSGELPTLIRLAAQQHQELAAQFGRILDWLETCGPLAALYTQQAIQALLVLVVRECYRPLATTRAVDLDRLEKVRQHIEQHYPAKLSLTALAMLGCLSKGYLLRQFKQRYGVTPIAYQQRLRVQAAMTLLKASAFGVGEIATKVGYGDIFQFSRIFRKQTGFSPSGFRRG